MNIEEVICIICNKKFKRCSEGRGGTRGLPVGVRSVNCKTCSKNCSRIKQTYIPKA